MASIFQSIIASALIGTERQPFTPITTDGNLGKLLANINENIDPNDRASVLLNTVAAIALYQLAGQKVEKLDKDSVPNACDLEDLPKCSDRTAYYLEEMVNGKHTEILPELLQALAANGLRVKESSLPSLLDLGKRQSDLREAIAKVLGKRGYWLAAQNPDWNYIATTDDATVWETGTKSARLMWLRKQREQNPDKARECLESTWKQETASDRTAFLEVLETNLSNADEPFLESSLGDRSKEVRKVIAELLTLLPESRFCQRAIERVRNLIKLIRDDEQVYFTLELPEVLTPEMIRDGIESKSKSFLFNQLTNQIGDRGFWLLQMLTVTPLDFWVQHFSMSAFDLVKVAKHSKSDLLIMQGWAYGAIQVGDLVWIRALTSYSKKQSDVSNTLVSLNLKVLTRRLSEPQQEARLKMIKDPALLFTNLHYTLLSGDRTPEVSLAILELIEQTIETFTKNYQNASRNYWNFCDHMRSFSPQIDPTMLDEAISKMSEIMKKLQEDKQRREASETFEDRKKSQEWGYIEIAIRNAIEHLLETLKLRQEMLESIA